MSLSDMTTDEADDEQTAAVTTDGAENEPGITKRDKELVKKIISTIRADKQHHAKAFKRMRRNMEMAMWGAEKDWSESNYRANIAGRHVRTKVAALYAKNPKAVARRRERLDFQVWDENPESLMLAYQAIQMAQMAMQGGVDPMTGAPIPPQLPPGFDQAMAVIQDFQQGMQSRQFYEKLGKTLEILFSYYFKEQQPVDAKTAMKQLVRRVCTCAVGYVEVGFQRETGPRPGLTDALADARTRLDHLRRLSQEMAEDEIDENDAEMAELEHSINALQSEPEIIIREGLVFDFPSATQVIPDKNTKQLVGFLGARHLTIEYMFTAAEIEEMFGVDIGGKYTGYSLASGSNRPVANNDVLDDDYEFSPPDQKKEGLCCVWKHYDKPSGLVYYVADGYEGFLRPPAAPDVFVESFWPVYALTFNAVESEDELFPPSDVELMRDMQKEHNRARQGLREHREAARPRWVYANGAFDEEDPERLKTLKAFEMLGLNIDMQTKIGDVLQTVPVEGVDPNLYETSPIFTDTQLVVGTQEAQFGGVSKATATETAIAANASNSSDGSSIDDLDSFLTVLARSSGQILLREASPEKVAEIVGPGAVWPTLPLAEIVNEIYLEIEAGSTGKPNQAVEINNWKQMLPMLLQMPNMEPTWLLRETLRRLDDKMDLTGAIAAGMPSIAAANSMKQIAGPAGPQQNPSESDPNQQGSKGANNAPQPPGGEGGSGPAFGSNQVAAPV